MHAILVHSTKSGLNERRTQVVSNYAPCQQKWLQCMRYVENYKKSVKWAICNIVYFMFSSSHTPTNSTQEATNFQLFISTLHQSFCLFFFAHVPLSACIGSRCKSYAFCHRRLYSLRIAWSLDTVYYIRCYQQVTKQCATITIDNGKTRTICIEISSCQIENHSNESRNVELESNRNEWHISIFTFSIDSNASIFPVLQCGFLNATDLLPFTATDHSQRC